jgi:hypothetical protein
MSRARSSPPRGASKPASARSAGPLYRGSALVGTAPARSPVRRSHGRARVAAILALAVLSAVAWVGRARLATLARGLDLGRAPVRVAGLEYLSPAEVLASAGLHAREPFFQVDLARAERRLRRNRRVRSARVERRLNGEIRVVIQERVPVALVLLGRVVEVGEDGVCLPPLVRGVALDLPVVSGISAPVRGRLADPDWARAVRWVRRLAAPEIGLAGRVSEIDVSSASDTRVVLAPGGTRLVLPRDVDASESLSALRVVLADLVTRRITAASIDCRARGLAVVEPRAGTQAGASDPGDSSRTLQRGRG